MLSFLAVNVLIIGFLWKESRDLSDFRNSGVAEPVVELSIFDFSLCSINLLIGRSVEEIEH